MSSTESLLELLKQEFMLASTDEKRIELARKYISILSNSDDNVNNKLSKNSTVEFSNKNDYQNNSVKSEMYATKLYEEGDYYFNNSLFDKAIKSYTHSLSVAPLNLLGLIFAKRAVALISIGKIDECFADIEKADHFGYTDTLHTKLNSHQEKCYKNICHSKIKKHVKNSSNVEHKLDASYEIKEKVNDVSIIFSEINCEPNILYSKYIKNNDIPCASEAISVVYDDIFGKHVVATRDIEPGEVLILEEAYAAVLNQKCWQTHCTHCLYRSINLQPCLNCSWAMFCSNRCQQNARKYHNVECAIVTEYMKINGDVIDTSELLTIRIIASIGVDSLFNMLDLNNKTNIQCNNSTSTIFDLMSHDKYRTFDEMLEACCIVVDIAKCCKVRDEIEVLDQLAGLILRIFLCRDSNAHGLIEQIRDNNKIKTLKIGSGIFKISSLVNHSCDPNVFRVNYCNMLIHRASRCIEKGTQIMISYGVQYDKTSKDERQKYLEKYYFDCSCKACINCWPLKENLPKLPSFNLQEIDLEKRFFELLNAKEKILADKTSNKIDQESLIVLNKKLLELLHQNKKCLNQFYVEVEYEFKCFHRMLYASCTLENNAV